MLRMWDSVASLNSVNHSLSEESNSDNVNICGYGSMKALASEEYFKLQCNEVNILGALNASEPQ